MWQIWLFVEFLLHESTSWLISHYRWDVIHNMRKRNSIVICALGEYYLFWILSAKRITNLFSFYNIIIRNKTIIIYYLLSYYWNAFSPSLLLFTLLLFNCADEFESYNKDFNTKYFWCVQMLIIAWIRFLLYTRMVYLL